MLYVEAIRDALKAADPANAAAYDANAATYVAELQALDAEIRQLFAAIPADRRKAIVSHEAFAYFEQAYGFDFIAPRISTSREPSARDIARLIDQAKAEGVRAVFVENITDPRLAERIAAEAGAAVGGKLISDALTAPDGVAPTYVQMFRHNAATIVAALQR